MLSGEVNSKKFAISLGSMSSASFDENKRLNGSGNGDSCERGSVGTALGTGARLIGAAATVVEEEAAFNDARPIYCDATGSL